ncbi:hypothetical protein LTR84_002122 [Exophiala bonariae]|uniref:Protein HRI1 n=1 Tax=Exophiala bonariae TaxID=1690606 RepID=A0AAV9NBD4_9EURO|nr:hypothetical protein LTR84_002122 [Exophiala bonariae]
MAEEQANTPNWAQKLLKRPLVEIRRGLSLGYDAPKEVSSVVALTVPSGRYVDIRFQLNTEIRGSAIKDSGEFPGYATAGMSFTHMPQGTESCAAYESTIHVQWEHSIDSSRAFDTDGADMYLLSNGDTMEIGFMMLRGEWKMFKEYWLDGSPEPNPSYMAMELMPSSGNNSEKGMVIRIGNYCQGILQNDSDLWVERWQTDSNGEWKIDARSTKSHEAVLPCQWSAVEGRKLGDSIEFGDRSWKVVETSTIP